MTQTYKDVIKTFSPQYHAMMYKCVHCGRVFEGSTAKWQLNAHLRFCSKRVLLRHLVYRDYLFIVCTNPQKRLYQALAVFINDPDTQRTPELVIGALMLLLEMKKIKSFTPIQIKNSPDYLKLGNGLRSYAIISKNLSEEDLKMFDAECQTLWETRYQKSVNNNAG